MTARGAVRRRGPLACLTALVLVTAGAVAGASTASAADVVPADPAFGGTLHLADANDGSDHPVGATLHWDDAVIGLPAPGDLKNRIPAPPGAQSVVTFVGPQGREADPSSWDATAPWDLTPPGQWMPDVTPYHLIAPGTGSPSGTGATAATSGDYSLGVAYLQDGGLHVAPGGLFFVHIHVTGDAVPTAATYTWQPVEATGPARAAPSGSTGAAEASDGALAFVAPAVASDGAVGALTVTGTAGGAGTGGGARHGVAGWTVVVSEPGRARTLASGSAGPTTVDASGAVPTGATPTTITLTLVSG